MRKKWGGSLGVAGLVMVLLHTGLAAAPFEYEAVRNDGAFGTPWSWLSLPGSRLVMNPYNKIVNGAPPPLDRFRMDLGYFGTGHKKAEHLQEAVTFTIEGAELMPRLTWMPHALQLDASCGAKGMQVTTTDFFADEHTVMRMAVVKGDRGLAARAWAGRFSGKVAQPEPGIVVIDAERYYCAVSAVRVSPEALPGLALRFQLAENGYEW